jgi:antitoxin (DNA-binding transcriptional repressor) of toxin-antitoxin stability system
MRIVSISVTEASRNFADCVNRARYQSTAFMLHKNGVAVAQIIPVGQPRVEREPIAGAMESKPAPRVEAVAQRKSPVPDIW